KPVLANGKCDVLKGQCLRSNAGLYYETYDEFIATLRTIEQHRWLAGSMGRNGRQFFREHYDWPVIERKYLDLFGRLGAQPAVHTVERLPGWLERRRTMFAAAETVLARIPAGPADVRSAASGAASGQRRRA